MKIIFLFIFIVAMFSCKGIKLDNQLRFQILSVDDIGNYYVYKAYDKKKKNSIVLLSQKFNCGIKNKVEEINTKESYNLNLKETLYIKLIDTTINTSLTRGLTIDDITISKPNKMPFLILNSCNGFLID